MQNIAQIDKQRLIFGNYAIRRFSRLRNCTSDPTSILQEFMGENRGDSLHAMVQAGAEASFAEQKKAFDLGDYEISELVDKLSTTKDKGDSVIAAFIGSVINRPAEEVPAWIEEVTKLANELAEKESKGAEGPNVEAGQDSQTGTSLPPAPTDMD